MSAKKNTSATPSKTPADGKATQASKPAEKPRALPAAEPDDFDKELSSALGAPIPAAGDDDPGDDTATGGDDNQPDPSDPSDESTESGVESPESAATDEATTATDDDDDTATDDEAAATGDDDTPAADAGGEEPAAPPPDEVAQLRQQVADLAQKLAAAAPAAASPQPEIRAPQSHGSAVEEIAAAETPGELLRLQDKFQQFEDFAADNPEGAELPPATPDGEPRVYTAEQVRSLGRAARAALRAIPRQAQYLQQRAQLDAVADKAYPEFADPKSDHARAYATYRLNPALRALPYLKLIVGDALAGMRARADKEKAAAGDGRPGAKFAPVARRPVPALPSGSARKPAPLTNKQARQAAVNKRLAASNGSATALAEAFEEVM